MEYWRIELLENWSDGHGVVERWVTRKTQYSSTPTLQFSFPHSSPGLAMKTDGASFCFVSGWRIVRFKTKSNKSGL